MNKIFQSLVVVLVVPFFLSPLLVSYAQVTEDFWTTKASMPIARSGLGVAVVNGKIYVIGGSYLSINEEYDPATDTWTSKTPMPTPRGYFGMAVYQNKIYVLGGQIGGQDPTGVNEVYDPSTDTWETKTSMPTPRKYLSANVVNGKIYLIGGCQCVPHSVNLDVNEVYDPAIDSWTTKTPMPTGVQGYASAVVDNKIYIIEGTDFSLNQIYDPETDSWSFGEPSPVALNFAAAGATTGVAAPKRIYVIGGFTASIQGMYVSGLVRVYNPEADIWTEGTSMPTPRYSSGVAVVNDVLYTIGGGTHWFMPETAQNEQYIPFGYGTIPVDNNQEEPFPTTWIVGVIGAIAIGGVTLLVYFKKVKTKTRKGE